MTLDPVRIEESKGSGTFHIAGESIPFRLLDRNTMEVAGRHIRFYVIHDGNSYTVWSNGRSYLLKRAGKSSLAEPATARATGEITALMPGKLLRLEVAVGETVSEKQTVAIMESMKMELTIAAPAAAIVSEVCSEPGAMVQRGAPLLRLSEPE